VHGGVGDYPWIYFDNCVAAGRRMWCAGVCVCVRACVRARAGVCVCGMCMCMCMCMCMRMGVVRGWRVCLQVMTWAAWRGLRDWRWRSRVPTVTAVTVASGSRACWCRVGFAAAHRGPHATPTTPNSQTLTAHPDHTCVICRGLRRRARETHAAAAMRALRPHTDVH